METKLLALFLLPLVLLAGCTSTDSQKSGQFALQQPLITASVVDMLPTRADIPTEFVIEPPQDITNKTKLEISTTGLESAMYVHTDKIEGSYGAITLDYFAYKFSTVEDATKYYDNQTNQIIEAGGYEKVSISKDNCFGYKQDFGFQAKVGEIICRDRNVVFVTSFASSNSFKNPDDFMRDGIKLLDKKIGD